MFTSCSKEDEDVQPTEKTYNVSFNTNVFTSSTTSLKAGETVDLKYLHYKGC